MFPLILATIGPADSPVDGEIPHHWDLQSQPKTDVQICTVRWPSPTVCIGMLSEAVDLIRTLWRGGLGQSSRPPLSSRKCTYILTFGAAAADLYCIGLAHSSTCRAIRGWNDLYVAQCAGHPGLRASRRSIQAALWPTHGLLCARRETSPSIGSEAMA
jgi:hypothetical protein